MSDGYLRYPVGSKVGNVLSIEPTKRHKELLITTDVGAIVEAVETLPRSLKVRTHQLRAMYDYLLARGPGSVLYHDVIDRWGFIDADDEEGQQCTIKRVILSTGTTRNFPKVGYFASSREQGGASEFWPIDFFTLRIRSLTDKIQESDSEADEVNEVQREVESSDRGSSSDGASSSPQAPSSPLPSTSTFFPAYSVVSNPQLFALHLDKLDEHCQNNLDKVMTIQTPGDRPPSEEARKLISKCYPNLCTSKGGQCLRAAIASSLRILEGHHRARGFLSLGPLTALSVGQGMHFVEQKMKTTHSIRLGTEEHSVSWLNNQTAGVYLVRMEG